MYLKNKQYLLFYPVIGCLFLLISSITTSFLYAPVVGDSALFMVIGKSMLQGKILYEELFDHKGPILFFIQAFGQWIYPGKTGIFILQVINLSMVLWLIHKISLLFIRSKQVIFVVLALFFLFFMSIGEGNKSEEFSLVFMFLPLYFALRYCFSDQIAHPLKYAFIYGSCCAATVFIRLNNSAVVAAVIISISIFLILRKYWKNLFWNAAVFLTGFLTLCLPISLYFYWKGAFNNFIYATFLHNLQYASSAFIELHLTVFLGLMMALFAIFNVLLYRNKDVKTKILKLMVILVAIFSFISSNLGTKYFLYYHILNIPVIVLGTILVISNIRNGVLGGLKRYAVILLIAAIIIPMSYYSLNRAVDIYKTLWFNAAHSSLNFPDYPIPENEKNRAMGYNVNAQWYFQENITPYYKYFTLQEWFSKADPQILRDFNREIIQHPPLWLMVRSDSYQSNKELNALLNEHYELKAIASERPDAPHVFNYDHMGYRLYRRKR